MKNQIAVFGLCIFLISLASAGVHNLTIDEDVAPIIYQFPVSSIAQTTATVIFNISDLSSIANCTAYISGTGTGNTTAINKSANNTIAITGLTANTAYTSVVNCTDIYSNEGNSSTESFTTLANSATTTTANTGGSGGTSYPINEISFVQGITISLGNGWKVNFNLNNQSHILRLDKFFNNFVQITLSSNPITFNISINETKKFDLDENGIYDIQIYLGKINQFRADITLKKINESIVLGEREEQPITEETFPEEEMSFWSRYLTFFLIVFVFVIIILLIFLWVFFIKKNTKNHIYRR